MGTGVRQERDPIERVRKLLLELELATAADLKAIEKRVKKEIDTAVKEAKESPEPSVDVLTHNIYMKTLEDTVRGVERLQRYPSSAFSPKTPMPCQVSPGAPPIQTLNREIGPLAQVGASSGTWRATARVGEW